MNTSPSPAAERRRTLLIAALAVGLVAIAWNVPALSFALYPLRLFVTFVHESGHGLATIATGGTFHRLVVHGDGSGFATTSGGARALILPAGYVGTALFGAILFLLTIMVAQTRRVSAGLAILVGLLTLLYADLFSPAFLVGLGFAALLAVLARRGSEDLNRLLLMVLALVVALNAVLDLTMLMGHSEVGLAGVQNDAAAFSAAYTPFIPAAFWAACWSGIALVLLAGAAWLALVRLGPRADRPSRGSDRTD